MRIEDPTFKDYPNAVGECLTLSDILLGVCGVSLTPYQLEYRKLLICSVLARKPLILPIQWARQTGKTEANVHTSIALSVYHIYWLHHSYPVAIVTPSKKEQAVTVTRERVRMHAERLKPWLKMRLGIDFILDKGRRTDDYIFRSEQGFEAPYHCVSASPSAFQKGQTQCLMFLEQVEDMSEYVLKNNILPFGAGSDISSVIVLAGSASPKVINEFYYQEIGKIRDREGIRPPWFVDDQLGAQYRPGYGDFIQMVRKTLSPDDPAYLTQFANVWVQPINKPFSRELLLDLTWSPVLIPEQPNILIVDPPQDAFRAVGIDVAKEVDSTVLTGGFRCGADTYIDRWLEMQNTDYAKQAKEAVDFIQRGKYTYAKVDKMGPGLVLADNLRAALLEAKIECTVEAQPLTVESNNRIYQQYVHEATNKRFHYPAAKSRESDRFFEQHVDILRTYGARSMMKLEAPSGRHDDYVASGALMVDALLHQPIGPTLLGRSKLRR